MLSIRLSDLTTTFLDPLKISEKTEVYLINAEGDFLYAPYNPLIGDNLLEHIKQHPFLGDQVIMDLAKKKLASQEEAKLDIAYPDFDTTILKRMLVVYSSISYNDEHLVLAVATSIDDALIFIAPFYINQLGVLVVAFLALIVISIVITRSRAYKEGLAACEIKISRNASKKKVE